MGEVARPKAGAEGATQPSDPGPGLSAQAELPLEGVDDFKLDAIVGEDHALNLSGVVSVVENDRAHSTLIAELPSVEGGISSHIDSVDDESNIVVRRGEIVINFHSVRCRHDRSRLREHRLHPGGLLVGRIICDRRGGASGYRYESEDDEDHESLHEESLPPPFDSETKKALVGRTGLKLR